MKTITIIQARMGSTRLPGKVLMPLGEKDVLSFVVARCQKIVGVNEVIVATSQLSQDDVIEDWCIKNEITCFRGSEKDVLDRYVKCAKIYQPNYVMRVTSDCPFVDYEIGSDMLALAKETGVEVIDIIEKLPRGLAVEVISYDALCRIYNVGREERHREHVTYYAYEFQDEFTRVGYKPSVNRQYPNLRITLDTEEDYALCRAVANHFNDELVSSAEVVSFLIETPNIANLNAHIEQKPVI
ncbi:glycosyltransferase family protein [Lysinibacillus sp. Y5S-8]|uniref:glycosyltransferase family protein n=1 Tax=Lysinibacillus sp. Y5S-8 TaxID=3122488 RepID=UPI0030CFD7ED